VIEDNILHAKLYFTMIEFIEVAGAKVKRSATDFEPFVVGDRELITGRNPRPDHPIAARLIQALKRAAVTA
jgi:putative intracellular protease/amidase